MTSSVLTESTLSENECLGRLSNIKDVLHIVDALKQFHPVEKFFIEQLVWEDDASIHCEAMQSIFRDFCEFHKLEHKTGQFILLMTVLWPHKFKEDPRDYRRVFHGVKCKCSVSLGSWHSFDNENTDKVEETPLKKRHQRDAVEETNKVKEMPLKKRRRRD